MGSDGGLGGEFFCGDWFCRSFSSRKRKNMEAIEEIK